MTDLPEPLVPPDCDLRDFAFMPLDIERLRRSKAWLIAKRRPEIAFYMLNLWTASWHDLPASSLEDDDDVLADLAMCEPRKWAKAKADALRGWVKCSDGRLYHPTVAEKARDAWGAKQAQRSRTEAARKAREEKRQGQSVGSASSVTGSVTETVTASVTENVTGNVTALVTVSKGEGEGEGEGDSRTKPNGLGAVRAVDPAKRVFDTGKELLARYAIKPHTAGGLLTQWRREMDDDIELMAVLLEAGAAERSDIVAFIAGCIRARKGRPDVGAETDDLYRRMNVQ